MRYRADVLHQETLDTASRAVARDHPDGIAVLVNNAGVLRSRTHIAVESYDPDEMSEIFDVNTTGVLRSCHSFAPILKAAGPAAVDEPGSAGRGSGEARPGTVPVARIVNITSIMGSLAEVDSPRNYAYSVSKAALNMLTRILHREFLPHTIGVLALHPGWVRTAMGGEEAHFSVEESAAGLYSQMTTWRFGDPGAVGFSRSPATLVTDRVARAEGVRRAPLGDVRVT